MSRRPAGLTLLEVLAALALISLLAALSGQLLFEAQRAQRSAADASRTGEDLALLRWQESIEAYLPNHPQEPSAFMGAPARLALPSALPPWAHAGGAQAVVWRLEGGEAGTRLLAEAADAAEAGTSGLPAIHLPPGDWAFRYAGADGVWQDAWPPQRPVAEDDRRLMLVALIDRRDGTPLLVARPAAEARAWGSLRLLGSL